MWRRRCSDIITFSLRGKYLKHKILFFFSICFLYIYFIFYYFYLFWLIIDFFKDSSLFQNIVLKTNIAFQIFPEFIYVLRVSRGESSGNWVSSASVHLYIALDMLGWLAIGFVGWLISYQLCSLSLRWLCRLYMLSLNFRSTDICF